MIKKQPKYNLIKQSLQNKIKSGEFPAGFELASETELMKIYNVSRVTARRALDELAREGYIDKIQGKRSIVKELTKPNVTTKIQSYTEEILRNNMIPSRKVLESIVRKATYEESILLQIDEGDYIFSLTRIYYANNDPLCYTNSLIPYDYFNSIENHNYLTNSLYHIIEEEYLVKLKYSSLKIKAVSSQPDISEYLKIALDTPVLFTTAITYGIIGDMERPVETFSSYNLTDKFEYHLIQEH